MTSEVYDCVVVGAGPAGLSASLFLARYHHRTITFHYSSPRNIYSHGVHGFLGHHGILPVDLLTRGREEVTMHGGLVMNACVSRVERVEGGLFRVWAGDPANAELTFDARRLLLATGLRDLKPDCPGFADFYGTSVFHCPDCDGYEVTGKRVVVFGRGKATVGFTMNMMTWTDRLTLVNDGEPEDVEPEHREHLARLGVEVLDRRIAGLEGDLDRRMLERVRFEDGGALECDALFFNLGTVPASDLHTALGCRIDDECGLVWVDDEQQTSVEGVFAAGDITPRSQLAVVAAAEGAMAAIHIHKSLIPADRRV